MTHVPSSQPRSVSRRRFLQTSPAAACSPPAAPYFVPRSAFGANERIVLGHIGVKNQDTSNLKKFLSYDGQLCDVAALCDVDAKVLGDAQALVAKSTGCTVDVFEDYRKLLERKDIDAVVISTPDHWHARMTIDGCLAEKDVYCEKPLTHTIVEGRMAFTKRRRSFFSKL